MYENRLADDAARSERIHTISFDAWRFGKEEVKRALLRHVFLALGGKDSELRDELYRQVQRQSTEKRPFSEVIADVWALWKAVGLQFALMLGGVLVVAVCLVLFFGLDTAFARASFLVCHCERRPAGPLPPQPRPMAGERDALGPAEDDGRAVRGVP